MPWVQFSDDKKTEVISVFGEKQDVFLYENQDEVDDTDSRYTDFISSLISESKYIPGLNNYD
jgi:hypothetical protein